MSASTARERTFLRKKFFIGKYFTDKITILTKKTYNEIVDNVKRKLVAEWLRTTRVASEAITGNELLFGYCHPGGNYHNQKKAPLTRSLIIYYYSFGNLE